MYVMGWLLNYCIDWEIIFNNYCFCIMFWWFVEINILNFVLLSEVYFVIVFFINKCSLFMFVEIIVKYNEGGCIFLNDKDNK